MLGEYNRCMGTADVAIKSVTEDKANVWFNKIMQFGNCVSNKVDSRNLWNTILCHSVEKTQRIIFLRFLLRARTISVVKSIIKTQFGIDVLVISGHIDQSMCT